MKKIIMLCGLLLLTFLWGMLGLQYGNHAKDITIQRDSQTTSKTDSEIRVLLKNDGYASEYHADICLTCDKDYKIREEDEPDSVIKPERKYRLHLRVPGLEKEMSFRFSLMVAGFISRNWSGQKKILDMREVWRSERPIRVCS